MKHWMILGMLAFAAIAFLLSRPAIGAAKNCYTINCLYSTGVLHACFKWNSGTLEEAKKYLEAEANGPGQVVLIECVDPGKEPIVVKSEKQGMGK